LPFYGSADCKLGKEKAVWNLRIWQTVRCLFEIVLLFRIGFQLLKSEWKFVGKDWEWGMILTSPGKPIKMEHGFLQEVFKLMKTLLRSEFCKVRNSVRVPGAAKAKRCNGGRRSGESGLTRFNCT
jgi:hypothetical protein